MTDNSYEDSNHESYEEIRRRLRDHILGDYWLMTYCLDIVGEEALGKGEDACRKLLGQCSDPALAEALKVDCGDNPKAMLRELLHLTEWPMEM